MLVSLALIFLVGMSLGFIFKKLKMPSLLGMIITGIVLSPYALDLLDSSILGISAELRQIALVIILTRAGLSLDINDLKKAGRPALLMCFLPATFEIIGAIILAPNFFGITILESAILGSVIAAVSPAVIVPRMIKIMESGYGKEKQIPQMILAGASADDVFVIVLFTSFTSIAMGENVSFLNYVQIPTSIILGIIVGIIVGVFLNFLFKKSHMRDSVKVIIMLSISFLILGLQTAIENYIQISGLIAIMAIGITLFKIYPTLSKRLSSKFNKLWVGAEIILFVLVGATVDMNNVAKYGLLALAFVLLSLVFRMLGVFISLLKTNLTFKERLFCMFAYCPKATVQAAIGAIPLSMGLPCGQLVLTIAVLSILITAPLGAFAVDKSYKKLLKLPSNK